MATAHTFPIRTEMLHSHRTNGHMHSSSGHRRTRLAPPFSLPRIPSERLESRQKGPEQSQDADMVAANIPGFSHHRRLLTDGLIPAPSLESSGSLNAKSRSAQLLIAKPSETGLSGYNSSTHQRHAELPKSMTGTTKLPRATFTVQEVSSAVLLVIPYPTIAYLFGRFESESPGGTKPFNNEALNNHWMVLLSSLGLISLALLLLGTYGKAMEHNSAHYDRKSLGIAGDTQRTTKAGLHAGLAIGAIDRIAAVGLPIWTACELGGSRLAVLLLVLAASGLMPVNYAPGERSTSRNWEKPGTSRKAIPAWLCLSLFSSAYFAGALRQVVGSSALLIWLLAAKSPYQVSMHSPDSAISPPPSAKSTSAVLALPTEQTPETTRIDLWKASPLIRTAHDTHLTLLSGVLLATVTVVLAALTCGRNFSVVSATKFLSCALLIDLSILFCQPFRLQTKGKFGCLLGIVVSMSVSVVSRQSWLSMSIESVLSLLGYFAAQYDDGVFRHAKPSVHKHMHAHKSHLPEKPNVLTKFLMREFRTWPLLHEILQDGNSRRIFYFMSINFAFMFIQMVYGYLTGSLGLISDSIHMLFDCVALLVGLCAVVLSNWPPSDQYPYGYGKLDQLAGLGNGVFLLLVTVEIFYGAFERLAENRSLERVNDLLIVSVLGLLVNIYGMLAFDHGHDHSHGHHDHHHDSDNMRGIYLHILGDALGSVGVVISTILVRYTGWNGWDPIASCIIAIIIGLHALPLVKRTAQSLLMALPDDAEYSLRNTLAGKTSMTAISIMATTTTATTTITPTPPMIIIMVIPTVILTIILMTTKKASIMDTIATRDTLVRIHLRLSALEQRKKPTSWASYT